MNSEKIKQKIKLLFSDKYDGRFFYKKKDLLERINIPKTYPLVQIYSALTQLIDDTNEVIFDKYGRAGHLVNIDDYYLFQPAELKNNHISTFERGVPIDFKHANVKINIKAETNAEKQMKMREKTRENDSQKIDEQEETSEVILQMKKDYELCLEFSQGNEKVPRGDDNWYKHCGVSIYKLIQEGTITREDANLFLVHHLVDVLLFDEKLELITYIYSKSGESSDTFEATIKEYLDTMMIETRRFRAFIFYSSNTKREIFIQNKKADGMYNKKWIPAEPEDVIDVEEKANEVFKLTRERKFNKLVGFIEYEQKNRYLIFKYKYMNLKRNTGARCDESGKDKKIVVLNEIIGFEKYNKENTKGLVQSELCSLQELLFRKYEKERKNDSIWFLNMEMSKWYDF